MRPSIACLSALLALALTQPAFAQSTRPDPVLFAFPSSYDSPSTGASAALGLADRGLGDRPFDNPALAGVREPASRSSHMELTAAPPPTGLRVGGSAALHRVSRQDLRADNREFDEAAFFVDPLAVWGSLWVDPLRFALYVSTPVLRREDNAFLRGEPGGPVAPASTASTAETREIRAGLAVAARRRAVTVGAALELTYRRDRYSVSDLSDAPGNGTRVTEFDGVGFGGAAGAQVDLPFSGISVGASVRYLPSLDLDGEWKADYSFLPDSTLDVRATRESGWEAGLSVADQLTPSVRLFLGASVRGARAWEGFEVASGRAWTGAIGVEYRDMIDPWTVRAAIGRQGEDGSATPQATLVGVGFGWRWNRLLLDFGILRRSLSSQEHPTSFDDRLVVTASQTF